METAIRIWPFSAPTGIGSVNVYLGHGDGTFGAPNNFKVATTNSGSRLLAVGDFDEDGIQDLVATNSSLNNVAVLLATVMAHSTLQSLTPDTSGNLGQQPWNVVWETSIRMATWILP